MLRKTQKKILQLFFEILLVVSFISIQLFDHWLRNFYICKTEKIVVFLNSFTYIFLYFCVREEKKI